ncbi:Werner Syndrome-like exonuclease [Cucurbita pepo subsp. pepo]|uniref:Werner Syndrome-like exonuclease n=1 Tax=Cucurbita pepo subsp. pepo TaxID=3664 RepID=UPI000C9D82F1|nr:Werner Syndrome-like exonuclease [Cucurbita pepo subsp. pepo]
MALTIVDREDPSGSHNYFDVTFDSDEPILTLLTISPLMVDDWISETLNTQTSPLIVGLDIEWRPNIRSYENPVATLQLCTGRRCLIVQLIYAPEFPKSLYEFLENESISFVGVGIEGDAEKLNCDYGLKVRKTVDLRNLAESVTGRRELKNAGLKSLAKEILGKEIRKPRGVTLSRWDQEWLTHNQIKYACFDAFISYEIGRHLQASSS